MKPNSKVTLAVFVLILAMLACNIPGTSEPPTVDEQAGTAVAATLTALPGSGTKSPVSATVSPIAQTPGTAASATTSAGKPTTTPTYSTPMLTVLQQTNCREGPGQDYQVIFTYLAKVKLEIIGRYDPTNFWLVKSPESKTGTCWLWGEYTEASGSYWVVPTLTPPPTATLLPPQAPSITNWDFSCSGGNMTFAMQWEDRATNETGYKVYRDGDVVAELPANSTAWNETIPLENGKSVSYYLQVYGPSGSVNTNIIKITC